MTDSEPYKYIITALEKRFNLNLKNQEAREVREVREVKDTGLELSHLCIVTQHWDELNEFIYTNDIQLPESKKPPYFDPYSKWSCILLPKVKIRWETKAKQVKIGQQLYHMITGAWDESGAFIPSIQAQPVKDAPVVKIYPYFCEENKPKTVLIPFKSYKKTSLLLTEEELKAQMIPTITIAKEQIDCVYAAVHYHVSFNRQGIYINRKFRETTEEISLDCIHDDFIIIEPAMIEVTLRNLSLIKIKLSCL